MHSFNLDIEIQNYCQSVHENGLDQEERIDELTDHLYCKIEHLMRCENQTEEQAFHKATASLGKTDDLKNEYSKNDTIKSILLEIINGRILKPMNPKKAAILQIVTALIFAASIITIDYFVDRSPYAAYSESIRHWMLIAYLIPLFYLSMYERKCGWCGFATIKQKVSGMFNKG